MEPETSLKRPGWNLSIRADNDEDGCYRSVGTFAPILTMREIAMMGLVNAITDKPDWQRKVFDDEIVAKWREETVESTNDTETLLSAEIFDWCIKEARAKAEFVKENQFVNIFDTEFTAAKSDTIVPEALRQELRKACQSLLDVPESVKDYHPGSNDQVLNLVHPSLFPLVYGRSRVMTAGSVPLRDCSTAISKGEIIPIPPLDTYARPGSVSILHRLWSHKFQWLPSEVCFRDGGKAHITSYINNLHPVGNESLYEVLEKFIDVAMPMWNACLAIKKGFHIKEGGEVRITCDTGGLWTYPDSDSTDQEPNDNEGDDSDEDQSPRRELVLPEPVPYEEWDKPWPTSFDLREVCKESGLQIIFKLASIELTPDKPQYSGGNWHVEGQFNERIAATALYYYDCENVTESRLQFRTEINESEADDFEYDQDDHEGIERVYGIDARNGEAIQEIGSVVTKQGRMLVFPNNYQHRVAPFTLADRSKPGHRRFLVMWLVDPWNPILSTGNVPPQQRDWWVQEMARTGALPVPLEIAEMVGNAVDDFPISLEEAKELRLELMAERTLFDEAKESSIGGFYLCEH